jgi:hypothetical protein
MTIELAEPKAAEMVESFTLGINRDGENQCKFFQYCLR